MPFKPSPLERWFTTHPGPYRHALGSTSVGPWSWAELARFLPDGWAFDAPFGYSEPEGAPELRARVAADFGVRSEQVLLAHGAADANFLAIAGLVRPGDEVVCQTPVYPQLPLVAEGCGARVLSWHVPESGPVDVAALSALVGPKTRLVILNSPHNPTGRVLGEEVLRAVAAIAEAQPHCFVLVDEVYRGVGAGPLPSSAVGYSERVLVSGSLSKAWALPGLRLGWLVGPAPVIASALPMRELTTLALSGLSEALALAIWDRLGEIRAETAAIATRNRGVVKAWLASQDRWHGEVPDASGCMLLRPEGEFDDVAACERWYQDERYFVIPGSTVGYPGALRVGFGHREVAALEAALAVLKGV